MRVVITGGAGQIAYALIPHIAKGLVFGNTIIELVLLDIDPAKQMLEGLQMELQDSVYELVHKVVVTTDTAEAFAGAEVAILLGGFPRKEGMERKDLIEKNIKIMRHHGEALERYANHNCKVLVVANPANTNAMVAMRYAPSIPPRNFSALSRLDHDRLRGFLAAKITVNPNNKVRVSGRSIKNCIIWGNHSSTQVPDVEHAEARVNGDWLPVGPLCDDAAWLHEELVRAVQNRGAAVIAARKLSSALSAANAIACHLHDWLGEPQDNIFVSMSVLSDGNTYGVPDGLIFSFPCEVGNGEWKIVEGMAIGPLVQQGLNTTIAELQEEKDMAELIMRPGNL